MRFTTTLKFQALITLCLLASLLSQLPAQTKTITIEGKVARQDNSPQRGVPVELSGGINLQLRTNKAGEFRSAQVPAKSEVNVTPLIRSFGNDSNCDLSCLSVDDLLRLRAHLSGQSALETPYAILAADINNDQAITDADERLLIDLLLGNTFVDDGKEACRFVPASYIFPNPRSPFSERVPSSIKIESSGDVTGLDFVSYQLGDVNACREATLLNDFRLVMPDEEELQPGQALILPVFMTGNAELTGLQFGIRWDPAALQLKGLRSISDPLKDKVKTSFGTIETSSGFLRFAWYDQSLGERPIVFRQTDPMFFLEFKVAPDHTGPVELFFDEEILKAVGVDVSGFVFAPLLNNPSIVVNALSSSPCAGFLVDTIGQIERITGCTGDSITFCLPDYPELVGGPYTFTWYDEDNMVVPGDSCFTIPSLDGNYIGEYRCEITDGINSCFVTEPFVIDTFYRDSNDTKIFPNQIVIQFRPDATEDTVQAFIDKFNMTPLDTCMCNDLFLFEFPDTMIIDGQPVIDPEDKKNEVDMSGDIPPNGSDWNYWVDTNAVRSLYAETSSQGHQAVTLQVLPPSSSHEVVLAISDTGFDPDLFQNVLWRNEAEYNGIPGVDDDNNCIEDDIYGYDFGDKDTEPHDIMGHGSFVGAIAAKSAGLDLSIENTGKNISLAPLKIFDDLEKKTSLFHVLCSVLYADRKGMDVFNGSYGWFGSISSIMDTIIKQNWPEYNTGWTCPTVYVFSAGNETIDLNTESADTVGHWPSNHTFNVSGAFISVGAYDYNEGDPKVASYSNFGTNYVDILANGTQEIKENFGGKNFQFEGEGTSFAAPVISGLAALMRLQKQAYPEDIKEVLLSNAPVDADLENYSQSGRAVPALDPDLESFQAVLSALIANPIYESCPTPNNTVEPNLETLLNLNVYPNPFSTGFQIEFELLEPEQLEFTVMDLTGRLIHRSVNRYTSGFQQIQWNAPQLPPGMYIYQLRSVHGRTGGKIIKN